MHSGLRTRMRRAATFGLGILVGLGPSLAVSASDALRLEPLVADYQLLSSTLTPPSEAHCFSIGRRCFNPQSMQASYNLGPLYDGTNSTHKKLDGSGQTIVIVDSFGSDTIASDLNNFNTQFGLPHMCGEPGVSCSSGMPTFKTLNLQGSPPTQAPPPKSNGTGLEAHDAWSVEVSLDVEWAHSIAPGANILLVTTPTAETLGVQGFPQMMDAEQYVVDHHLGSVISQSFGAAEETFGSTQSLLQLRHAFIAANNAGITVLASSGDFGSANVQKQPVKTEPIIPFPTVGWPGSDPLVTAVGGTYLCTDPTTGASVDSTDPPTQCQANAGVREIGWIDSGGGYSHVFSKPDYQSTLPAGSTAIGSMRGVPDVAYQASSRTGVLVYDTDAGAGGWFVVGGTSAGSPQWAGIVAIAAQLNGGPIGNINPALYRIGANPARYAADFYDVTKGNNAAFAPTVPGYPATPGWDPVTGLGTPNAATFVPDLVKAVHGG